MTVLRFLRDYLRVAWHEARARVTEGAGRTFGAAAAYNADLVNTVTRACPRCTAPGLFKSEERIHDGWPRCWVPPGDPRDNKSVGDYCPQCGAVRDPKLTEHRGIVWRGRV